MKRIRPLIIFTAFYFFITLIFTGCKKDEEAKPLPETGTVTDIDGNVYNTVKIGDQWWMSENLKVKKFRNGTTIELNQDDSLWKMPVAGYCLFDNNPNAPGLLYNWYAINNSESIAPEGWHIPSDQEWKNLEMFLGMSSEDVAKKNWRGTDQGDKLKKEDNKGWTDYTGPWGNNESGFSAEGGSCRLYDGTWGYQGLYSTGFWWSSSQSGDSSEAWYRYLDYKNSNIFRSHSSKNYGFSVRCVKD